MSEILTRLLIQFDENIFPKPQVYNWWSTYREGRERVENEPHERFLWTSRMEEYIHPVHELIVDDWCTNVQDIVNEGLASVVSK